MEVGCLEMMANFGCLIGLELLHRELDWFICNNLCVIVEVKRSSRTESNLGSNRSLTEVLCNLIYRFLLSLNHE